MTAARLAPKTIVNYAQVVKMVVASAVNAEGEQIYLRTWNHDFIGLPIVRKEKQHRPTLTETELGEVLSSVKRRYSVLSIARLPHPSSAAKCLAWEGARPEDTKRDPRH